MFAASGAGNWDVDVAYVLIAYTIASLGFVIYIFDIAVFVVGPMKTKETLDFCAAVRRVNSLFT